MRKPGKKFAAARQQVPERPHTLEDAVPLMQKVKFAKFDETVELSLRLGVEPKHADQMVRGTVVLPAGTGKSVRVLVIAIGTRGITTRRDGEQVSFLVPGAAAQVEQEGARGVGCVGGVDAAVGELPEQPRVDRAKGQFTLLRPLPGCPPDDLLEQAEFHRLDDVFIEARAYGDAYTGAYTINVSAERLPRDNIGNSTSTGGPFRRFSRFGRFFLMSRSRHPARNPASAPRTVAAKNRTSA